MAGWVVDQSAFRQPFESQFVVDTNLQNTYVLSCFPQLFIFC